MSDPRNYIERWRQRASSHLGRELTSRELALDYARYDTATRLDIDSSLAAELAEGAEVSIEDGAQMQADISEIKRMRELLRTVGRQ